ncbi:MAG: hypothetical protein ACREDR_48275 [Blastocatellia bacterium]
MTASQDAPGTTETATSRPGPDALGPGRSFVVTGKDAPTRDGVRNDPNERIAHTRCPSATRQTGCQGRNSRVIANSGGTDGGHAPPGGVDPVDLIDLECHQRIL